jgi:hypothetical protein
LLRWFRDNPQTPHRLRRAAVRLTAHVNKDHDLPFAEDPCEDARLIVDAFRR